MRVSRILACLLALIPVAAFAAASPAGGTLTEVTTKLTYTGGPIFSSPNAAANNACANDSTSEAYNLTVTLPDDFNTRRPDDGIKIDLGPVASGDLVLSVLDGTGKNLGNSDAGGPGGEESISLPANTGTSQYKVLVCVFAGSATSYQVTITLTKALPVVVGDAYTPRFQYVLSPPALGNGAGEPSLGYNPKSKRGIFQAGLESLRVTFPERRKDDLLNPGGLPESCDVLWEDVSFPTTSTVSLDPIGLGDFITGRYYASQLGAKSNSMAYTDDDGANWSPSAGNFPGAAGVDHQTVGWGPYVAGGTARPLTAYPNAIYYCSQDIAYANCSRSDDGGTSFLPPVIVYNTTTCGGLHGHIRAAPDGTVYLPNKSCGSNQAVAVSQDNGLNWEVRKVPTSTNGRTDPQMALASDGTGYFCYTANDGRPRVAVTHDKGKTWAHDTNLGAAVGVVTAVFAQGIAGNPDRAACGFIGTTTAGNSGAVDFPGIWYPYIAVTYDGGVTWSTTNASPSDPAQGAGGVCTGGTTCGANRNLLDFNDMALDELGRPMLGFADGCVGTCVSNPSAVNRSDKAAIARVVGGKSLYVSKDLSEPRVAQAACLAGTRPSPDAAALTWRAPADDGTSAITGYKIYRGTTAAAQSLLLAVNPKTAYTDYSIDPIEPDYFYRIVAVNGLGDSVQSNLIKLSVDVGGVGETICTPPGLTILQDAEGDELDQVAAHDVRKLSVSQPYFANGDYKIYFHLKMTSLSTVPANTYWPVNFCSPSFPCVNPDTNTKPYGADNKYYTVRMSTVPPGTPAAPVFEILKPTAAGTTAGSRTIVAALPESSYSANGLITLGVKASDLGLANAGAGTDQLSKFQTRIMVNGVAANPTPDNMPDGLAGTGVFTTVALNFCSPNTPPQAVLDIDAQTGPAPLTVMFDGTASSDADTQDSIAEYIFDFGDGSENISQATPAVSHTYDTAGAYNAKLRVKDSRGLTSTSAAARVIEVTPVLADAKAPAVGNNVLGGAMPPAALLLLGLLAALRRRR